MNTAIVSLNALRSENGRKMLGRSILETLREEREEILLTVGPYIVIIENKEPLGIVKVSTFLGEGILTTTELDNLPNVISEIIEQLFKLDEYNIERSYLPIYKNSTVLNALNSTREGLLIKNELERITRRYLSRLAVYVDNLGYFEILELVKWLVTKNNSVGISALEKIFEIGDIDNSAEMLLSPIEVENLCRSEAKLEVVNTAAQSELYRVATFEEGNEIIPYNTVAITLKELIDPKMSDLMVKHSKVIIPLIRKTMCEELIKIEEDFGVKATYLATVDKHTGTILVDWWVRMNGLEDRDDEVVTEYATRTMELVKKISELASDLYMRMPEIKKIDTE